MTPDLAPTMLALVLFLELLGRVMYRLDRDSRSRREAAQDRRRGLSYLGEHAPTLLRDLYRMEKRYLPLLGWLGAPNMRLPTISTNTLGFRDDAIEPRQRGEYRILVTGGSLAWGLGASCNGATVAAQIQALLDQQAGTQRHRVMSGAFLNWTSRQEYVVVTEFFDRFDPDLVISLSGYNDLMTLAKGVEIGNLPEARLLEQAVRDELQPMTTRRALRRLAGTLGIWRLVVLMRETLRARGPEPQQHHRYDDTGGPQRIERTIRRYLSIADFLARRERRYLIALEPEIYSSEKPLTVEEFDLKTRFMHLEQGIVPTLTRYRRELLAGLEQQSGDRFRLVDLAGVFDTERAPVFIDYNHVCDRGNTLIARALVKALPGA